MTETVEIVDHEVYYSDTLVPPGVAWTQETELWCKALTIGVSPTIDMATLEWQFGQIGYPGEESDYVAPIDLEGKYVRIEVPDKSLIWYGYVLKSQISRGPQETVASDERLTYGTQLFTVVGIEWFLDREVVNFSIVNPDVRIERAIGFNCGFGTGRGLEYEDRANKQSGVNQFAANNTTAILWNGRTAVDYLLGKHNPKNAAGSDSPVSYVLAASAVNYIDWFDPIVQTEGKTVFAVLNEIISRNRSLVWWLELVVDGLDLIAEVNVQSMALSAVSLPGGNTLPANATQVALTAIDSATDSLTVVKDLARSYDVVICRGARKRAVFTVSYISENLVEGWRPADETDYLAALGTDPRENDRYREANKFERVFQVLNIPPDWNGASNDGGSVPGATDYSCPKLAQGSSSIVSAEPVNMPGLRLLASLPLKDGYDYTDATAPVARDPSLVSPEFRKPFAVVRLDSTTFRYLHKLSTTPEGDRDERFDSYHMLIVEGTPGLQFVGGKLPHTLAKFTFDTVTDGPSDVPPEVDYREIRGTVAAEWDAWCEGMYPLTTPTNAPVQRLCVSLGDRARHDWLADNTIIDCENGTLKLCTTGGALRDDRDLCVQVAQIAYQWYGVERSEIDLTLQRLDLPVGLGNLVTSVSSGDVLQAVNAIVTQITLNFDSRTTSIMAGFAELDFAGLV
jgi:hypothetical protein